jgi:hypothetical protein
MWIVTQIQVTDHARKGEGRALWLVSPHFPVEALALWTCSQPHHVRYTQKACCLRILRRVIGGMAFYTWWLSSSLKSLVLSAM